MVVNFSAFVTQTSWGTIAHDETADTFLLTWSFIDGEIVHGAPTLYNLLSRRRAWCGLTQ